jgi:hypothetical protein
MDSGRSSEVYAMLGEIRSKQEAYRAEYAVYAGVGGSETTFFPALGSSEPKSKSVTTGQPTWWSDLGIAPTRKSLYCGYTTIGGPATGAPSGTRGKAMLPTVTSVWWYAVATCDNDGDANSSHNAYFQTSSATNSVYAENEHW